MKFSRSDIVDAAVSVVIEHGVGASTSKFAKAAGVSNGTLFNYFPTKQDLIDELYVQLKSELAAALGELDESSPLRDQSRSIWDRWIGWARAHPDRWKATRMLHEAGLVSEAVVASVAAMFVAPVALLDRLANERVLVELPIEFVAGLIQSQIDHAIQAELNSVQHGAAFEVMWRGITAASESERAASTPTVPTAPAKGFIESAPATGAVKLEKQS